MGEYRINYVSITTVVSQVNPKDFIQQVMLISRSRQTAPSEATDSNFDTLWSHWRRQLCESSF